MKVKIVLCVMVTLGGLALFSQPVRAEEVPSTQGISQSSSVDDLLDALDSSGKSMKDMSADVKTVDTNTGTGAETTQSGKFALQKKSDTDARVMIKFTSRFNDTRPALENHDYILDNGQLIERDYIAKKEIIRQLLKPGQQLNLLKLGEGPFPLPIGQKKEDVKAQFEVTKVAPAASDPPGTIHLQLIPGDKTSFARKFQRIDVWIDPKLSMPTRIQTLDATGATQKTTDLTNLKINSGLEEKDFTEPALPEGWEKHDEPYGE